MTGKTILICDDALVVRAELRTMLERHGFTVITADDGDVAAEVASRHPELDLCIMDYNMPTMNGLERCTIFVSWRPIPVCQSLSSRLNRQTVCSGWFRARRDCLDCEAVAGRSAAGWNQARYWRSVGSFLGRPAIHSPVSSM